MRTVRTNVEETEYILQDRGIESQYTFTVFML